MASVDQPPPKRRRRAVAIVLAAFVVIAAAAAGTVAWQVDDWNRDLTTNWAVTSSAARDPELRSIETTLDVEKAAELVRAAAASLPRWTEQGSEREGGGFVLHFVHTGPLLPLRDDVTVIVDAGDDGSTIIRAISRSRMGKGDLGQNPRNLKDLFGEMRKRLR
ncbi:MAG: DUF1499 domain-containing protein [Planctomycetia bacterium]|nr:DUF1499 domain-containing protein [Planctomycetia bacterium]